MAWLETGRHSAALWCIIKGREGEESEFKGTKVSDEENAWQVIPSKRQKRHLHLYSNSAGSALLTAAQTLFQAFCLHIHIQEGSQAQGGRVQVFIPLENPFIHFNVFSQQYCCAATEPPAFPHKHNTCTIKGVGEGRRGRGKKRETRDMIWQIFSIRSSVKNNDQEWGKKNKTKYHLQRW